MPPENQTFFSKHRNSIIITIVAILVAVGLLTAFGVLKNVPGLKEEKKEVQSTLSASEIEQIANDVPTGPETLTPAERQAILKDNSGPETLTAEERAKILSDNPK